jgi:hypothetical protein
MPGATADQAVGHPMPPRILDSIGHERGHRRKEFSKKIAAYPTPGPALA